MYLWIHTCNCTFTLNFLNLIENRNTEKRIDQIYFVGLLLYLLVVPKRFNISPDKYSMTFVCSATISVNET